MQGRVQMGKRRRRRYRCPGVNGKPCGRAATFEVGQKRKADADHKLCDACFRLAKTIGRKAAKKILFAFPEADDDGTGE